MKEILKATGIVVEYNPFHYGHLYHITKTKEINPNDVLIAVMSPNFVQRGEPAIIDKFSRTHIALLHGVDLILELPTHLALQSAETFARSAIHILSLAKVDTLVYGSETLEIPKLQTLNPSLLKKGHSYAYAKNINKLKPNQILAAYYEDEAQKQNIKTARILRTTDYHDLSISKEIASASAIRENYFKGNNINHTTPIDLNTYDTLKMEDAYPFIRYELLTNHKQLNHVFMVDEGIENMLYDNALKYDEYDDFLEASISKRYTRSRIQRTLCHILLKTPQNIEPLKSFRVLGMSKKGQQYLKILKEKDVEFHVSFKTSQFKDLEFKATSLYSLLMAKKNPLLKLEVGKPIVI